MVLGHEPAAAAFDAGGMTLSAAPALLPPLDEPPTARVLKELDVTAHMKRKTAVADPAFRLVLPGQRLDVMPRSRRAGARARTGVRGRERLRGRRSSTRLRDAARAAGSDVRQRHHAAAERLLGAARGRPAAVVAAETDDRSVRAAAARSIRSASMAASPAVHGAALVAHDVGPICEARAFEIAAGASRVRRRPGRAAGAAVRPAGDVRRRSPRAPDARRGRRPAPARRRRSRAAARRDHRLPSPAVGGLGGGAGRGAGARRRRAAQAPGGRARDRLPLRHRGAGRTRGAARRHAAAGAGDRRSVARR